MSSRPLAAQLGLLLAPSVANAERPTPTAPIAPTAPTAPVVEPVPSTSTSTSTETTAPIAVRANPGPETGVRLGPIAVPAPAPIDREDLVPPTAAQAYRRRSTSLFVTGATGLGPSPGTSPWFSAGAVVGSTVRSLFDGLLFDAGLDLLFEPLQPSGGAPIFQLRPSARLGYVGAVGERVALGVRGGYSPSLAVGPGSAPGFIHQLDLDLHCTVITRRAALIEPFLSAGVLIASPVLPVGLLGVRIGAEL